MIQVAKKNSENSSKRLEKLVRTARLGALQHVAKAYGILSSEAATEANRASCFKVSLPMHGANCRRDAETIQEAKSVSTATTKIKRIPGSRFSPGYE